MKTIGLLGGMSWESSAEYYRLANEGVRARLGGLHSARLVLSSLDFADIERLQAEERWDDAAGLLGRSAVGLERAGAELLLLCTNTMHLIADQVQAATTVPLLHIADTTAVAVLTSGVRRVGLLGTAFTMERPFLRDRLAGHGLDVMVPDEADRRLVHAVIYDELCRGVVREASRQAYREVIGRLVEAGAEGVVLGCTEIELLIGPDDSPVPTFPTTRLHVDAALDLALAEPTIGPEPVDTVASMALVSAYLRELAERFPGGFDPAASVSAGPEELSAPGGAFLVVRDAGRAVGCGGVKSIAPGVGEVKRMWLAPGVRGRGLGRALLAALEQHATGLGHRVLRLDTSAHLPEALALYRSAGYLDIPAYNDNPYAAHWLEKHLLGG